MAVYYINTINEVAKLKITEVRDKYHFTNFKIKGVNVRIYNRNDNIDNDIEKLQVIINKGSLSKYSSIEKEAFKYLDSIKEDWETSKEVINKYKTPDVIDFRSYNTPDKYGHTSVFYFMYNNKGKEEFFGGHSLCVNVFMNEDGSIGKYSYDLEG